MRFLVGFLFTILLYFPFYYFMPWWWWGFVIPAALISFGLQMNSIVSFLCGFLSIGLFWGGMAFWSDTLNDGVLLEKMSKILPLGSANNTFIALCVLGGLLGGLSMLSGKLLRDIVSGPVVPPSKKHRGKFK